jgi:zinc protease
MKSIFLKIIRTGCLLISLLVNVAAFSQNNTVEFTAAGLKVILHQTQKETLVMSMYFRGGSSNYVVANAGIESLALSGAMECGTAKYAANDFNEQVDEYGLHLGGIATNDYGVLKLSCIARYKDEAWKLFSSAIVSPVFEIQKFNLLKEQKINTLKAVLSDPDARLKWLAQEFAFAGTTYATNPEGTVNSLPTLSRDAVKDYYYNTLLNKSRMFLVVAGNISKEELEKKITDAFTGIASKAYTAVTINNTIFTEEVYKIEPRSIATNYVAGVINAPNINNPNYPAFRLAVSILGGSMFDYIRLEKQLSYAPSASISEGRISYVTMYASTTQPAETVKAMHLILSFMQNKTYSEKILNNVRKDNLHAYIKRQEIMAEIADQLGSAEIMGDWKLAENLPERMSNVSAEDVQHVLNIYAKNISWAYIGDAVSGKEAFTQ